MTFLSHSRIVLSRSLRVCRVCEAYESKASLSIATPAPTGRSVREMTVTFDDGSKKTTPPAVDVNAEILVTHFCIPSEAENLLKWCAKNAPRPNGLEARVVSAFGIKNKADTAAQSEKWDVAVWMYLGALHHLDFSPKAAAEMQAQVEAQAALEAGGKGEGAAVAMSTAGKAKGEGLVKRVNAATLLVLMNLSFAFLARQDPYNAERAATLGMWFADRAHPSASNDALDTTTTDKDVQQAQNARVKLLFRRGSARYQLVRKADSTAKNSSSSSNPERFAEALADLMMASSLDQADKAAGKGDRVLQGLLAEVLTAHKGAGGKLLPPVSTSPSAGTGSGSSSSSSGASHEAAAAAAEQAEESMSMSNAMSEAGWMGPQDDGVSEFDASELEAAGVSLTSSSSSSAGGWDPVSQLWKRFKIAVVATSWQRPLTLAFGLLLAQAAYVTCEFPGYERVTWMSSLLPVVLLALQPLIEQWPRGEIDSTAGEANNYYPGGLVSTSSSSGNTSGSGKGKAHPPSEDRSSKMKSKSKTASSKKAN